MLHKDSRDQLRTYLALSQVFGIGPSILKKIILQAPCINALVKASRDELKYYRLTPDMLKMLDWQYADHALKWVELDNHHIIVWGDQAYPPLLKEISLPPPILFVHGKLDALQKPQLSMVGSRNPSATGLDNARQFAQFLVSQGFVITSGLAYGIDAACHQAVVDVGGVTIAVLGSGLTNIYPSEYQQLAQQIAVSGAVISEFPLDTPPAPEHFPRRNRIISGLSSGTIVVEATLKSGSLITAQYALEQNREVFALPGSIHNPLARGCHKLLKEGAKLVESGQDIMEELAVELKCGKQEPLKNKRPALAPQYQKIVKCVGHEMTTADAFITRSGLSVDKASAILVELELLQAIKSVPGGYVRV